MEGLSKEYSSKVIEQTGEGIENTIHTLIEQLKNQREGIKMSNMSNKALDYQPCNSRGADIKVDPLGHIDNIMNILHNMSARSPIIERPALSFSMIQEGNKWIEQPLKELKELANTIKDDKEVTEIINNCISNMEMSLSKAPQSNFKREGPLGRGTSYEQNRSDWKSTLKFSNIDKDISEKLEERIERAFGNDLPVNVYRSPVKQERLGFASRNTEELLNSVFSNVSESENYHEINSIYSDKDSCPISLKNRLANLNISPSNNSKASISQSRECSFRLEFKETEIQSNRNKKLAEALILKDYNKENEKKGNYFKIIKKQQSMIPPLKLSSIEVLKSLPPIVNPQFNPIAPPSTAKEKQSYCNEEHSDVIFVDDNENVYNMSHRENTQTTSPRFYGLIPEPQPSKPQANTFQTKSSSLLLVKQNESKKPKLETVVEISQESSSDIKNSIQSSCKNMMMSADILKRDYRLGDRSSKKNAEPASTESTNHHLDEDSMCRKERPSLNPGSLPTEKEQSQSNNEEAEVLFANKSTESQPNGISFWKAQKKSSYFSIHRRTALCGTQCNSCDCNGFRSCM